MNRSSYVGGIINSLITSNKGFDAARPPSVGSSSPSFIPGNKWLRLRMGILLLLLLLLVPLALNRSSNQDFLASPLATRVTSIRYIFFSLLPRSDISVSQIVSWKPDVLCAQGG